MISDLIVGFKNYHYLYKRTFWLLLGQMKMKCLIITTFFALLAFSDAQKDPHWWDDRNSIVHLFEWKWNDIADECERWLSVKGYAGVQVNYSN